MKKSNYKKTPGGKSASIKGWLDESPFICLPKGCKKFYKKALNKIERRRGKQLSHEELNKQEDS
jgi:hypothetical protein